MIIATIKETSENENRVAITPESAKFLIKLGHEVIIQSGAGDKARFSDKDYKASGCKILKSASGIFKEADVIAKVNAPSKIEQSKLQKKQVLISFIWPAQNNSLLENLQKKGVTSIAMDMVPRISRAQKMDALSSMSNIAGYRAVVEATNNFDRFLTGQITAAGKVPPAKVLVIGAGVAGLAAIGTSVSLGAIVRAFDVRPEVAEQIESMGAEFLMLDFDEGADGSETGGYAAPSSPEFREKQLECFRKQADEVDIVITTALIPGMDAPKLWLKEFVDKMKPGSVIVDLAAEKGGNCDLTKPGDKIVTKNNVTIVGYTDFPSRMASQSSTLYSTNIRHMIDDLTPKKDGKININMKDDVIRGSTVTHNGEITFPPPPPKVQAIAKQAPKPVEKTPEDIKAEEVEAFRKNTIQQTILLCIGGLFMFVIGNYAPSEFMQHMIVFALACFVGFQVIWNVSHALHTPLMAVTNAISGIIIIGAVLQMTSESWIAIILAAISVLISTINIVGGFLVTRRMLAMFQKS
ncbi:MAG: Re/Si-specific NAD(P)(+) transhydrogenase subunit alpha [Pseudomonadota bacterium]|nr:Re/Si-specific NAD(P)(+) transhydrogenase subunit alpha [Pseudomonadota bacterium]